MRIHPFRALRPSPGSCARVASPPYDVVSRREAAALARDNPQSFLHVVRSDIDLADDIDPYDARVYAKAKENLDRLVATGTLGREDRPAIYLYREIMEGRAQVGVLTCVHVGDYESGIIKKHETTRPDKEDDRTRHIVTLRAHAEPVLLAYGGHARIDALVATDMAESAPLCEFTTADGVRHSVWRASDPAPYVGAFGDVACAYVADGHHRSASAARAARRHGGDRSQPAEGVEDEWFPAALVPAGQLRILPYNRLVADLAGQSPAGVLERLASIGRLAPTENPKPSHPRSFCIYLARRWYLLELSGVTEDRRDPVSALDVSLLQERVLGPVLGIGDQRTDKRIEFVGGIRGPQELEKRVDGGEAALAISMFPTTVTELMTVADAGQMMPPKSTWFEPKLLSGLFVHLLD